MIFGSQDNEDKAILCQAIQANENNRFGKAVQNEQPCTALGNEFDGIKGWLNDEWTTLSLRAAFEVLLRWHHVP
jgi:hypothetical protein